MHGYICCDCHTLADSYDEMAAHTRSAHAREPLAGRNLAVGNRIRYNDMDCRVLELHEDGSALVQPVLPTINVTYRVFDGKWERAVGRKDGER